MLMCMKITIPLDDELLIQAKALALQTNRTLTVVIEEALRQHFGLQPQLVERKPVRLKTVDGKGVLSGVDLDNSAAIFELLESSDDDPVIPSQGMVSGQ